MSPCKYNPGIHLSPGTGLMDHCVRGKTRLEIAGSRLKEWVITDSIQPTKEILAAGNIRILEIASLIGEAIGRTAAEESVSSLFD